MVPTNISGLGYKYFSKNGFERFKTKNLQIRAIRYVKNQS